MVARADDPAAEIQDGIQIDQARGGLGADDAHLVEHDGHQASSLLGLLTHLRLRIKQGV